MFNDMKIYIQNDIILLIEKLYNKEINKYK